KDDEFCKRLFEVLEKEEKDLKARIAKIDTLDLA
ncbi:glycosyltransferase family 2 protein, partial [Campylobacter coli]|nr:glycosyltransferase family 2 protein [Campylobacter coli]